jgi:hypothetical protein
MQTKHTQSRAPVANEMMGNTPTSRFAALLARIDWAIVFRLALIAVNVGAVIYALSKITLAYSIGGALYALVVGGQLFLFLLFFAAFAAVMVKRYDVHAMFSTAMALVCAFSI